MYDLQAVSDRIKDQAKQKKISMREMLVACDLGINAISQLAKGKALSSVSLARIADYLDCSVDYLLGRTDNPKAHLVPADFDFAAFEPNDLIVGVAADPADGAEKAQ